MCLPLRSLPRGLGICVPRARAQRREPSSLSPSQKKKMSTFQKIHSQRWTRGGGNGFLGPESVLALQAFSCLFGSTFRPASLEIRDCPELSLSSRCFVISLPPAERPATGEWLNFHSGFWSVMHLKAQTIGSVTKALLLNLQHLALVQKDFRAFYPWQRVLWRQPEGLELKGKFWSPGVPCPVIRSLWFPRR